MASGFLKRLLPALALTATALTVQAGESITLASTTSTENSGLFGYILPIFEKASGIQVKVVALGTGQALDVGKRGDADALLVHDRAKEEAFVAEGFGAYRKDVMYNDFVVVGPAADPAGIASTKSTDEAFAKIADSGSAFASRADRSGTHSAEMRFWKGAGKNPEGQAWYKASGSGMGATLNMAAGIGAYTLSDRGSWALQEPAGSQNPVSGRPEALQPLWRDSDQSGQASACEEGSGRDLHQLDHLRCRPPGDRRLQTAWRAVVLPPGRQIVRAR